MAPKPFTYEHFILAVQSLKDDMLMYYIDEAVAIYCRIKGKSVGPRPASSKDYSPEYADAFEAANYAIFITANKIGAYNPDKGAFRPYLRKALESALRDIFRADGYETLTGSSEIENEPDTSASDAEERVRRHKDDAFETMIKFIDTLPEIKRAAIYASAFGQILRPDLEGYGRNYADILAEIYHTTALYIRQLATEGKKAVLAEVRRQGFDERSMTEVSMGMLQVRPSIPNTYDKVIKALDELDGHHQFLLLRHIASELDNEDSDNNNNNSSGKMSVWGDLRKRSSGEVTRREDLNHEKEKLVKSLKDVINDSEMMAHPRVFPGKLIRTVKTKLTDTPSIAGVLPTIEDKQSLLSEEEVLLLKACLMLPFKLGPYNSLEEILRELDVKVTILPGKPLRKIPPELQPEQIEFWLAMKLRGLYCPEEKTIKLFPDNMEISYDGKCMKELLVSTLAHEAMHAYFDRPPHDSIPVLTSVEEPMAEFGMLVFMYENRLFYHWAEEDVSSKKTVYRYGYALMRQHRKECGSNNDTPTRRDLESYRYPLI